MRQPHHLFRLRPELIAIILLILGNTASSQELWWAPPNEKLDSMVVRDRSSLSSAPQTLTVIVAHKDIGSLSIIVESQFEIWDTVPRPIDYYAPSSYLIVTDRSSQTIDTLWELHADGRSTMQIVDVQESLLWDVPLFYLESIGSSDINEKQFLEYRCGKVRELFSIDDLVVLQRDTDSTFRGVSNFRDELVGKAYECPLKVSLNDYRVEYQIPDVQTIDYNSTVVEEFVGYRYIDGNRMPFKLKVGTNIRVDTFYRMKGLVLLIVADGGYVIVDVDTIMGKIETESAG
jgi:hypothetical protein